MTEYIESAIPPKFLLHNILYDIDSIPEIPQCHAANIVYIKTQNNETILFCAWFAGSREGNLDVGIWFCEISYTFSENSALIKMKYTTPRLIAKHSDRACGNPVLFLDPQQRLHLWYPAFWPREAKKSYTDRQIYHKISMDMGKTWSEPELFSDRAGLWTKNPVVVLKNGSWLLPLNDEYSFLWRYRTFWSSRFAFSHDQGKSWQFSELYSIRKGMIQPSVVQFPEGDLYCINRSRTGWLVYMRSTDNGMTWTKPKNTPIPNNNANACMTLLHNGQLVMAYNPTTKARTPISIAISKDHGQHWVRIFDLWKEPGFEFSYPCILETPDGLIHVVYTFKRRTIAHDVFVL